MNKFIWTDEYLLGIPVVDEQHKHFFEIVNNIYDLIESGDVNREKILKIVKELVDYGYHHFSTEEKYFNQFLYDDRAAHMDHHNMFRKKTSEYMAKLEADKDEVDMEKLAIVIDDFAKDWLAHHILGDDRKYIPFFKQNKID